MRENKKMAEHKKLDFRLFFFIAVPKLARKAKEIYIEENLKGELTTDKLESLVLDFDETFKSYKQVTNLRSISGSAVVEFLNSPQFAEISEQLSEVELLAV